VTRAACDSPSLVLQILLDSNHFSVALSGWRDSAPASALALSADSLALHSPSRSVRYCTLVLTSCRALLICADRLLEAGGFVPFVSAG